jgi:anaerobic selenocysteine-containing dehydrogenase
MSRCTQGGQAIRAVSLLPGVVGAYAKRGGGALLMTATSFGLDLAPIRRPSGPARTREVNHSRLGDALLTMTDPPIRALFIAANNPAVTCPDAQSVRRGLAREDLFTVVHDPFLSDTARFADLVLPAATYLESEDLYRSYGTYYMQLGQAVVPPQGEARTNRALAAGLAKRLDITDAVFSMSTDELIATVFRGAQGPVTAIDPGTLREHRPIKLRLPDGGPRWATPSGRLEFYSEHLAAQGLAAMPDWIADPVDEAHAARWPLRLLTAPGYYQSHTAFSGNSTLRRRAGAPECVLHPADARKRGLTNGDDVALVNDLGEVRMRLRVSDEVGPGVVLVPGQRPSGESGGTTINMLCSTRYADLGEGATYQSTCLDARRV